MNIKYYSVVVIFCIISLNVYSQNIPSDVGEIYQKENLAIYPFIDSAGVFKDDGAKITELVENTMVNMKRFNIVDRKNIDKYLKEMELQLAGLTDKEVIEIGKIYGYNKAVFGSIVNSVALVDYGNPTNNVSPSVNVIIDIIVNIADVSTTKILHSSRIRGSGSSSLDGRSFATATAIAKESAYRSFLSSFESQMRNIFKITLKIADIQKGGNVILLAGNNQGVSKGLKFRVYRQGGDMVLSSGSVLKGSFNKVGSIRVASLGEDYSIAKITRGFNIKQGDVAEEMILNNVIFGIFATYSSYKINPFERTYTSGINSPDGDLKLKTPKMDYSFGLHIKSGYNFNFFAPNISVGILFADFFKSSFAVDARLNLDININLVKEVLRLTLTPYFGVTTAFNNLGTVSGKYYLTEYTYLKDGSSVHSTDLMVGGGAALSLTYNITDTIGISAGAGYRFYTKPININIYGLNEEDKNVKVILPEKVPAINLTGIEAIFSFNALF